jgi:uncharacterized membrane protein
MKDVTSTRGFSQFYLGLLLLVAAVLRLPALGRDSFWFDEAISYVVARLPLAAIFSNITQDPHPPFYYSLLHIWYTVLPNSDVNGRLLSLILNLLLIPLIYWFATDLFHERKPALIAALLVAISPFHVLYSHELRMYTLLMLLAVATAFTFLRAYRSDRWSWWGVFTLFALLMVYTHLFSLFVLLSIGLYALHHRHQRQSFLTTVAIGCLLFLLFLPWLLLLLNETNIGSGSLRPLVADRTTTLNPIIPLTTLAFLIFGQASASWQVATTLFLALASVMIFLLEIRKAHRRQNLHSLLLPGLIVLCTISLPCLVYYIRPFFLPERTMAAASPFLLILLSWGISRWGSPLPYLLGATTVLMLTSTLLYLTGEPVKPPYREVIQFVASQREIGDVVLHSSDSSYLPSLAYMNSHNHALLAGNFDIRKPEQTYEAMGLQLWSYEQVIKTTDRLWLIVALEYSEQWQREQVAIFDNAFPQLEAHDFAGVTVIIYDLAGGNGDDSASMTGK